MNDYECKMEEDLILLKICWFVGLLEFVDKIYKMSHATIQGRDFADGNLPMAQTPGAFCTGVLWALAEQNRLRHVTHLSSVSGGLESKGWLEDLSQTVVSNCNIRCWSCPCGLVESLRIVDEYNEYLCIFGIFIVGYC